MSRTKTRTNLQTMALTLCATMIAFSPDARAQSVTLGDASLIIKDSLDTTQVEIGAETIVEAIEIRVLGPGPDLQALIDGITDAAGSKHYVIRLGPGEYSLTSGLVMKPFVSLAGSGQAATFVKAGAAIENLLTGADNMSITDLTIDNAGGSATSVAIYNDSAAPTIARVAAKASGGTDNHGVYNTGASPVMTQVTSSASGAGTNNYGVYNTASSSPVMSRVLAAASEASNSYGVYNDNSAPAMTDVTATASAGTNSNYGVRNDNGSSPAMTRVTASASDGQAASGVYNDSSSPVMTDVVAAGSDAVVSRGVYNDNSSSPVMMRVVATASGTTINRGVYNKNSSSPTMTNVSVTASGGEQCLGLTNESSSAPVIKDSDIRAENGTIANTGMDGIDAATRVYNTLVVGGVANDAAGTQCQSVYDDTPASIGC